MTDSYADKGGIVLIDFVLRGSTDLIYGRGKESRGGSRLLTIKVVERHWHLKEK